MRVAATTPHRLGVLNRTVLTAVGLPLVLGGGYSLARGAGLARTVGHDPTAVVVPAGIAVAGWAPYAVIASAAVVGLLCLWWLLAQFPRRDGDPTWQLGSDVAHGTTRLETAAAATAFAAEVTTYEGVSRAKAVIFGDRGDARVHLRIDVDGSASVRALRDRIDTVALPRLRGALELDVLPTEVLVRLGSTHPAGRVR